MANTVDPRSAASDLDLHCLLRPVFQIRMIIMVIPKSVNVIVEYESKQ